MSRLMLCSVGTSLLNPRGGKPWTWSPAPNTALPDPAVVDRWLSTADPAAASAETNTLRLLEPDAQDRIALLHSDTPEGAFCAERLCTRFTGTVREVSLHRLRRLGYGATTFTEGLKAMIDVAIDLVLQARTSGEVPVICATGGFKAEIAFLNVLGALLEVEVVYLHELHRELVRLPRLPLTWNADFVAGHEDFFLWVDQEPRASADVESWLASRPALRMLVEDGDDGHAYLSAAGELLRRTARARQVEPRATWPKADAQPPSDKNGVSVVQHHRPTGWEEFVHRLCSIDCVSRVAYDAGVTGGRRVRVLDPRRGTIGVRYERGGEALPLRVETTARGDAQCELVAAYLDGRH